MRKILTICVIALGLVGQASASYLPTSFEVWNMTTGDIVNSSDVMKVKDGDEIMVSFTATPTNITDFPESWSFWGAELYRGAWYGDPSNLSTHLMLHAEDGTYGKGDQSFDFTTETGARPNVVLTDYWQIWVTDPDGNMELYTPSGGLTAKILTKDLGVFEAPANAMQAGYTYRLDTYYKVESVPEPATLAALGGLFIPLVLRRRRK